MDTGNGMMEMIDAEALAKLTGTQKRRVFSVGEEVTLKDSRFRIVKITPKKLTLRVLPKVHVDETLRKLQEADTDVDENTP